MAAAAALPLDAVRDELRRLTAARDIAARFSEPAYHYELLRAAADAAADVDALADSVGVLERAAVRKLDAAHALLAALAGGARDSAGAHADIDAYFANESADDDVSAADAPPRADGALALRRVLLRGDAIAFVRQHGAAVGARVRRRRARRPRRALADSLACSRSSTVA